MDALILSRWQFAAATAFHFLFVPLTLGLSLLVAIMETRYVATGNEEFKRLAKFWGKIFVINFALGVVTGITLEFQFGTNWSRYSAYVGDIFGSLLAVEATVAFFLESTFIGLWIFGWDRLSPKFHMVTIWLVALASNLSAYWILAANSFMQHPVGYVIRNGRAELTDFLAVATQPFTLMQFIHTLSGAYILSGFFVMAVSAYNLLRKKETDFFQRSFRLAVSFALIFALVEVVQGHLNGETVAEHQPAKLAAMESHWETQKGAGMSLLTWPDAANETNYFEFIKIPSALSILAYRDPNAEVKGLKDFPPEDRPPVWPVFLSFRIMVGLGALFVVLTFWGFFIRHRLMDNPLYLKIILFALPLPYLANEAGWMVAEIGRQPWIVQGIMRTSDAVSPIAASQVGISLAAFVVVYGILGLVAFGLMARQAKLGPAPAGKVK